MLAAGINVAVGTDSCASSPNLNLVDDLRLLHTLAPEMPALALWRMATLRAAMAIDMTTKCGQINNGAPANLAIFKTNTSDPLTEILESDALPLGAGRLPGWPSMATWRARDRHASPC